MEKNKQALQADSVKCVKITDMFSPAAGPSSAPMADDDSEEDKQRAEKV